MRHSLLAILLAASATAALHAAPTPKEQLLKPPPSAARFVVVSTAGKHGDEYLWRLPDGRLAFRESILLRGLVWETDQTLRLGPDGMPAELVVRGISPSGDASETFRIDRGQASWTSPVDKGSAAYSAPAYYLPQGGTFLATAAQVERLLAAGPQGMALLPSGRARIEKVGELRVTGAQGPKTVALQLMHGLTQSPQPVWTDGDKFFGQLAGLGVLPAGYEHNLAAMQKAQDDALAALAPAIAERLLSAGAAQPTLFHNVRLYDAEAQRFVEGQSVLVEGGKIASVGPAAMAAAPTGARIVNGAGKTLVPGLWDAHMHAFDDFNVLSEVALGVTSIRNPGGSLELAVSQRDRRAQNRLVAPEAFSSVIIDGKGPLSAQGSTTVTSQAETLDAVRKVKAAGLSAVKFYTSMKPEWIAPGAAEAHRLGLHVHGHVPATMRPLDVVRAGYDEITHINFVIMQAMPAEVVATSNGANRFVGPGKYAKDVDLDAEPMRSLIAELARRKTVVDPTLVVYEIMFTQEAGNMPGAYAPFVGTLPAAMERSFKSGGYPLPEGYTRADFTASFAKLQELVGRLHKAGVPIVAGTDGYGLELVRELELYVAAGLSPAEALATATIVPARVAKVSARTGSITVGKEADLLLVDGDPSKRIGDLRRVAMVMSDGVLMDGDAVRKEAGFSGRPK